jgi:hypothetical protein
VNIIRPQASEVDPIDSALEHLTLARDMLQLTIEQLDDPTMLYLVEDLSIILQRLDTISSHVGRGVEE